jgi:hypothetical protein
MLQLGLQIYKYSFSKYKFFLENRQLIGRTQFPFFTLKMNN